MSNGKKDDGGQGGIKKDGRREHPIPIKEGEKKPTPSPEPSKGWPIGTKDRMKNE